MDENENARKSGPLVVLLALLAFLGFRTFTPDSAAPSGENAKPVEEREARDENGGTTDDTPSEAERLVQTLKAFQDTESASDFESAIEKWKSKLSDFKDALFLIACVPDPIDSTSGYRFDGLIDAIQRAAETQNYVLDRYYYPWPNVKGPGKGLRADPVEVTAWKMRRAKIAEKTQVPLSLRIQSLSEERPWTRLPGVLLLRAPAASSPTPEGCSGEVVSGASPNGAKANRPRLLLVFLVGETATAGLHKEAFTASLQLIKKWKKQGESKPIRVLGPHFSGSQVSLEKAISANCEGGNPPTFRIISGNASGIDRERLECKCCPANVCFEATVAPDCAVMGALFEYLNLGWREGEKFHFKDTFAILHESNTTFGQLVNVVRPQERHKGNPEQHSPGPSLFPFPCTSRTCAPPTTRRAPRGIISCGCPASAASSSCPRRASILLATWNRPWTPP